MRSLKSVGCLTRGSGVSERQRAYWPLSVPVTAHYNVAMLNFADAAPTCDLAHKDFSYARNVRDTKDMQKLSSTGYV